MRTQRGEEAHGSSHYGLARGQDEGLDAEGPRAVTARRKVEAGAAQFWTSPDGTSNQRLWQRHLKDRVQWQSANRGNVLLHHLIQSNCDLDWENLN